MSYRMSKVDWALAPILVGVFAAVLFGAFRLVGFLGVGILGLIVAVVAVQVDQERGWPVGVQHLDRREAMTRAERAGWHADLARNRMPLFVAKVVGAGLIILGFGLFATVQLPG